MPNNLLNLFALIGSGDQKLQVPVALLMPEPPGEIFTIFYLMTLRYFVYKLHRQLSVGAAPNISIREAMM